MNIFGDDVSEPESLKKELVDFAANWTSFIECEIYLRENDEAHGDNSEDLESELDLWIEIQLNENDDAIGAGGSENVAFEGEVNLDNVDSELESTSEDSRVTA